MPWFARVPSASKTADEPSRFKALTAYAESAVEVDGKVSEMFLPRKGGCRLRGREGCSHIAGASRDEAASHASRDVPASHKD